jgi:hypothetical protein
MSTKLTAAPLRDTLFTTSVWSWQLPRADCQQMADKIRELQQSDPGRTASNRLGWQSRSMTNRDIPIWLSNSIHEIRDHMLTPIYQELGLDRTPQVVNFWYNVNPPGAFNWTHSHPNCSFSSVIYLENTAQSGPIVFENPQAIVGTLAERAILPREGAVLLFPATTLHRVEPNLSTRDRITIAVNWI